MLKAVHRNQLAKFNTVYLGPKEGALFAAMANRALSHIKAKMCVASQREIIENMLE